mmetsp:Transcript_49328/g.107651  ORF Transcript_49328/g.107651 Transcript_49328/m.107651 type:complete len:216 (+) Transcript_49328:267-914(+)
MHHVHGVAVRATRPTPARGSARPALSSASRSKFKRAPRDLILRRNGSTNKSGVNRKRPERLDTHDAFWRLRSNNARAQARASTAALPVRTAASASKAATSNAPGSASSPANCCKKYCRRPSSLGSFKRPNVTPTSFARCSRSWASEGICMTIDVPCCPARPVRPDLCINPSAEFATPKWITQSTPGKSSPRAARSVAITHRTSPRARARIVDLRW